MVKWKAYPHPQRACLEQLICLKPSNVLSQTDRLPFEDLPLAHLRDLHSDIIEEQYRKILHISWIDEKLFEGKIPTDSVMF